MPDKVFIIAEAGVNHNGSLSIAKQLINAAADAKADAVKFQTFIAENVISKFAEKAEYQKVHTGANESQLEMVKKLQLSFDDFVELKEYCYNKGIMFLSTAFDLESLEFLKTLNLEYLKIPSGEITNLPYLEKIGKLNQKIILSTGMCSMYEIESAVNIIVTSGTDKLKITVLHCNTEYPTPMEDVNLNAMLTIGKHLGVSIGYSDHTQGIEVAIAAVALGATVIEKHFTLDKNMEGPDHKASLEPGELEAMVRSIRNIELSIGDGLKLPTISEMKNRNVARKSIVANKTIKKNETFTENNLTVKRPGNGISPMQWNYVIGKKALRNFNEDELIEL